MSVVYVQCTHASVPGQEELYMGACRRISSDARKCSLPGFIIFSSLSRRSYPPPQPVLIDRRLAPRSALPNPTVIVTAGISPATTGEL